MVSVLASGSSGPGSSPGWVHCVVFLGKTLYFHSASLYPVYIGSRFMLMNPAIIAVLIGRLYLHFVTINSKTHLVFIIFYVSKQNRR